MAQSLLTFLKNKFIVEKSNRTKNNSLGLWEERLLVWFSCGAASAVTARECIDTYGKDAVQVLYCNTLKSEHTDNIRFLNDIQNWLDIPIKKIGSASFVTIDDVFEQTRYMAGINGARCTTELKKIPRLSYQLPDDIHFFGYTADEKPRIKLFERNNPDLNLEWILRDKGITKNDCYARLASAGIALPVMYALGFNNNNCIGCVKAQSADYWNKIRANFPDVFQRRCEQSRKLGVRLLKYHGVRQFLDELPLTITDTLPEGNIECGPQCNVHQGYTG